MKTIRLFQGRLKSSLSKLSQELGIKRFEILTRIDKDPEFCKRVAGYMLTDTGSRQNPNGLSLRLAKIIMGEDKVIGPEKIQQFFQGRVMIKESDVLNSSIVPYLPETLGKYKESHLLVFGVSIPISLVTNVSAVGFEKEVPAVVMDSSPKPGWFLIDRFVNPFAATEKVRLATIAEAYYAFSIHSTIARNTHFLHNQHALCLLNQGGKEVYLGLSLTRKTDDYRYLIRDVGPHNRTEKKISIIVPDDPVN